MSGYEETDEVLNYDWDAQRAAQMALAAAVDALFTAEENDEIPDTPFCGCDTCVVRTVLEAAWPFLYRGAQDSRIPAPPDPYLTAS